MNRLIITITALGLSALSAMAFNLSAAGQIPPKSGVVVFEPDPDFEGAVVGPVRDYVGPNRLASDDRDHRPQNEAFIIVNPSNPDHLLGGCNDYRSGDASAGYYYSFDGGQNWEDDLLPGLDDFDAAGNPSLCMNREGNAWFCGIHFDRGSDHGGIFVHYSEDGGRNWEGPSYVIVRRRGEVNPPFEDKPIINIDNSGGDHDGNLYVSWTRFGTGQIYFSRSTDGGENWADPLRLYAGMGQGSFPVVSTDGGLYVIWIDYSDDRMIGRYSDDGGESFGDIIVISDAFRLPRYLNDNDVRVNSIPSVAVDHSDGEHRDRIYVAWADIRSEDPDILMVWSDDGEEWSDPLRLNDDEFQNGRDQFFPWLAVDPVTGILSAVWYDRRLDDDNILLDVFGVAWDGNGDLPANERITSESSDPRGGPFRGRFIGDEIGIAALAGKAHPAWSDTRNDNQDIYYATFEGDKHFYAIDGENEHHFIIESVTINGEPPESSDEAAVLDCNNRVIGSMVFDGEEPWEFIAAGDWTERIRYAYMKWIIWDRSEDDELVASPVIIAGDKLFRNGGETELTLEAPPPDRQVILIDDNWNLVSTNIYPVEIDIWEIFLPVSDNIRKIGDERGGFLTYQFDFSNMSPFNPLEALLVGTFDATELVVQGTRIDAQTPVPLEEGWNYVSYLPDYDLDPWNAFDNILESLFLAKDDLGNFLIPRWGFSNMEPMTPGEGYMVNVEEDVELVYPEPEERSAMTRFNGKPEHFPEPTKTAFNMSILVSGIDGFSSNKELNGELAAFSAGGKVCGAAVISSMPPWGLAVWESGDKLEIIHGSPMTFRYYDRQDGQEYNLSAANPANGIVFESNGFAVVTLTAVEISQQASAVTELVGVSPNPVNSEAVVTISLPQGGQVNLSVYDLNGREVASIYNGRCSAGMHQFCFNASDFVSGLYIIRFATSGEESLKRVIVLK